MARITDVANLYIFVASSDVCLQPDNLVTYVWNFESQVQFAGCCPPWRAISATEKLTLRTLELRSTGVGRELPVLTAVLLRELYVIHD